MKLSLDVVGWRTCLLPAVLVAFGLMGSGGDGHAASPTGTFAIKGIGLLRCDSVVKEFEAGSPNSMMVGGWIYGYLTAMNQTTVETFELAPWQDLNTLTNYVIEHCRKNQKITLAQSVFSMVSAMNDKRLIKESKPLNITVNQRSYVLYEETLTRITAALRKAGHYKGSAPTEVVWTPELTAAVKSFQAKRKINPTGEPDQITLHELLQR